MNGPADTMQLKDEIGIGLGVVEQEDPKPQTFVLQITTDYTDRMLLGNLSMQTVMFHVNNMLERFVKARTQKIQIKIEKEKG